MAESQRMTDEERNEFLFIQLVLMFQGAAMQHLGKVKNPLTDRIERDLDQARNTIDILSMLEAKTKGNLNPQEKRFLEHVLFELRMNYVDEVNRPKEQTEPKGQTEEKTEEPAEGEQTSPTP